MRGVRILAFTWYSIRCYGATLVEPLLIVTTHTQELLRSGHAFNSVQLNVAVGLTQTNAWRAFLNFLKRFRVRKTILHAHYQKFKFLIMCILKV